MFRRLTLVLALLAAPVVAQVGAQSLPPVPHALVSQIGPVPIRFVPDLKCGGEPVYGCFDGVNRTIFLRDSMPLEVQWHTLFHEQFHLMLHDGGQSLRNADGTRNPVEERIADAYATARVHELTVLVQFVAQRRAADSLARVEQAGRPAPP